MFVSAKELLCHITEEDKDTYRNWILHSQGYYKLKEQYYLCNDSVQMLNDSAADILVELNYLIPYGFVLYTLKNKMKEAVS